MDKYITLPVLKLEAKGSMAKVSKYEYYAVLGGRYLWLGCDKNPHRVVESVAKMLDNSMENGEAFFMYDEDYIKQIHELRKLPKPVMRTLKVNRYA